MKNPWSERLNFVVKHIEDGVSIVDFGCGNREILDVCNPSRYLGIDCVADADLVADLDQPFEIPDHYNLGLVLGVLEYLQDPEATLMRIRHKADRFIILTLTAAKKPAWRQNFSDKAIKKLLSRVFTQVEHYRYGRYLLSECTCQ